MIRSKKKPPRWRREQKARLQKDKRAKLVLGVMFLGLIMMLVVISWLWQRAEESVWDGKSSLGIVYQVDDRISLVTIMPEYSREVEFIIPSNTMAKVGFGFGEYQLKNVYQLGKLEGQGGKVLSRTVQELMGIGIRGWKVGKETNLSWWDRARLWWYSQLVVKKRKSWDLGQDQVVFKPERLADGVEVFRVSQVVLDELVNQQVFEERLVKEGLSLAILNATGVEGVAKDVTRLIANLGGEVRLVGNLDKQMKSEILLGKKDLRESYTVEQLARLLEIEEIKVGEVEEYRSEVVVVVGQDYTNLK